MSFSNKVNKQSKKYGRYSTNLSPGNLKDKTEKSAKLDKPVTNERLSQEDKKRQSSAFHPLSNENKGQRCLLFVRNSSEI